MDKLFEINKINQKRELLLAKEEYSDEEDKQIDDYANQILEIIKKNFDTIPFDFIMHQLSFLGQAPNLVYDDNGHWAVTSDGFQSIPSGDEPADVELFFFIEAKYWKKTPKEALKHYIFED